MAALTIPRARPASVADAAHIRAVATFRRGEPLQLPSGRTTWIRRHQVSPDAPWLLLLHGISATGLTNFSAALDAVPGYNVVAVDHRGHGRGIRSNQPFTLQACAEDALEVCAAMGLTDVIVSGYSMGGMIGELACLTSQERGDGIVAGFVPCATTDRYEMQPGYGWLVPVAQGTLEVIRRLPWQLNERMAVHPILARYEPQNVRPSTVRFNHRSLLEAMLANVSLDLTARTGTLRMPIAQVLTTRDTVVTPRSQEAFLRRLPGATVVRIAEDHRVVATNPQVFRPAFAAAVNDVAVRAGLKAPALARAPGAPTPIAAAAVAAARTL